MNLHEVMYEGYKYFQCEMEIRELKHFLTYNKALTEKDKEYIKLKIMKHKCIMLKSYDIMLDYFRDVIKNEVED